MQFNQIIEENRKALGRIAAFLFALADLAERAASRSRAVCRLVLWLLGPAESVARNCLDRLAPRADGRPLPEPREPYAPAEALRLAASFRALATAFAALADDGFASWQAGRVGRPSAALLALSAPAMRLDGADAVARLDSS
ncbi:MAG: hypothetical protein K5872_19120 [Rhizobiaceae bacterium]|nr:hypothetical protein [Rhizobiaceae bacterium]MCV0408334.1 hypothetical protein [Rhizobiaceae bacterium]